MKETAYTFFFSSGRPSQVQLHTVRSINDELWRHSYNMLKAPLLKVLLRDPENFQKALVIFYNILKVYENKFLNTLLIKLANCLN